MQATQKLPQLTEEERSRVEKIYEDYNSLMYRTACGLTGSREDAGDLVQDCLISLMRHIETVSTLNPAQTAGYIVITLKHLYANTLKNKPEASPWRMNRRNCARLPCSAMFRWMQMRSWMCSL